MTELAWGQRFRLPAEGRVIVFVADGVVGDVSLVATTTAWTVDASRPRSPDSAVSCGRSRETGWPAIAVDVGRLEPSVDAVAIAVAVTAGGPDDWLSAAVRVGDTTAYLPALAAPPSPIVLVELRREDGWRLVVSGQPAVAPVVPVAAVARAAPVELARSRRPPGRVAAAVATVAVVAAGAFGVLRLLESPGHGRNADPSAVALPPSGVPADTAAYLKADGAPLVRLAQVTAPLAERDLDKAACSKLLTADLPPLGDPPALLDLATRVPDRATSEMAVENVEAVVQTVQRCAQGQSVDRSRLDFAHTVFVRRLQELGVQ